jgi:hypothetical protein
MDEDAAPELWEHQGHGLTVGTLRRVLRELPADLAVRLSFYDGTETASLVDPIEVGLAGTAPDGVIITGSRL